MGLSQIVSCDPRPHINQDKPQTKEQIFSTNFYHDTFGTSHLKTVEVLPEEVEQEGANAIMMAFKLEGQNKAGALNMSDCGTGKTRAVLDFLCDLKVNNILPPVVVLAPLTILEPAWGGDVITWTPNLSFVPCYATKRKQSATAEADIHLFNHDAVKWIMQPANEDVLEKFKGCILVIDEFTAYKNIDAQRTQAAINLSKEASMIIELSGTPMPRTVLDIFTPALIADGGARLGNNFYRFRSKVCTPIPLAHDPRIKKWEDKPDALAYITQQLGGISFRFEAKDVPLNTKRYMEIELPPKARKAYKEMLDTDLMVNEDGTPINAVNAGARFQKLLQLCSGAVYNEAGEVVTFHQDRYELVTTLACEVEHAVVGFNWKHERVGLEKAFRKRGLRFAFIDGTVKVPERVQIVEDYQNGYYDVVACHPQSAGHGLTMTKGTRTIWCSASNNAEHFLQYNKRIDRKGQTQETETIMLCAKETKEEEVYKNLFGKVRTQAEMLAIFAGNTKNMQKT